MGWEKPTSDDGVWTNPGRAYDDTIQTYAETTVMGFNSWSDYLTLNYAGGIECNAIRFITTKDIARIEIELYYGGAWQALYDGEGWLDFEWNEIEIGSVETVTAMRFRFFNIAVWPITAYMRETDFWEVQVPELTTDVATDVGDATAELNGTITDDSFLEITERGFDYGLTDVYGSEWTEIGSYAEDAFDHILSSLQPGRLYYFRAKAENSEGWGYGTGRVFLLTTSLTGDISMVSELTGELSVINELTGALTIGA